MPWLDHRQVSQAEPLVDEGEDRVQVHIGALRRQLDEDQVAKGGLPGAHRLGQELDPLPVGALAQAHDQGVAARHQQVAAFEVGAHEGRYRLLQVPFVADLEQFARLREGRVVPEKKLR